MALMLGAVVGGRLLHVLYEEPGYYLENPLAVLKIWQGGFVFYGGLFGALATAAFWSRRYTVPMMRWADFFAPVLALGYALGRLGCFFNGCCHGRVCELPWAVAGRHPTQLYATSMELLALFALLAFERRKDRGLGSVFFLWLVLHALNRLVMEHFRDDDRGPTPLGFSLGTWVSLLLLLSGVFGLRRRLVSN